MIYVSTLVSYSSLNQNKVSPAKIIIINERKDKTV